MQSCNDNGKNINPKLTVNEAVTVIINPKLTVTKAVTWMFQGGSLNDNVVVAWLELLL